MSLFYGDEDDPKRAQRRPMLVFILVTLAVGAAGTVFTEPALRSWYPALIHPALTPPDWLFAPVWTTLYILMAVAAWRVWRVTGTRSVEMALYAIQLALNAGWSLVFFGLHKISAALMEILVLDLAILATIVLFFRRDRLAGWLMAPYLGWTIFASLLTLWFAALNP